MATKIIGGATAKDWLDSGASQLIADPATFPGGTNGGPYVATDANATDPTTVQIFDALDRDALIDGTALFGIEIRTPRACMSLLAWDSVASRRKRAKSVTTQTRKAIKRTRYP